MQQTATPPTSPDSAALPAIGEHDASRHGPHGTCSADLACGRMVRAGSFRAMAHNAAGRHSRNGGKQRVQRLAVPSRPAARTACGHPKRRTGRIAGNGAQEWNRTTDTAIFSRMLYQLSYLGAVGTRGLAQRRYAIKEAAGPFSKKTRPPAQGSGVAPCFTRRPLRPPPPHPRPAPRSARTATGPDRSPHSAASRTGASMRRRACGRSGRFGSLGVLYDPCLRRQCRVGAQDQGIGASPCKVGQRLAVGLQRGHDRRRRTQTSAPVRIGGQAA